MNSQKLRKKKGCLRSTCQTQRLSAKSALTHYFWSPQKQTKCVLLNGIANPNPNPLFWQKTKIAHFHFFFLAGVLNTATHNTTVPKWKLKLNKFHYFPWDFLFFFSFLSFFLSVSPVADSSTWEFLTAFYKFSIYSCDSAYSVTVHRKLK